jgi:hypothetical protein
VEVDDQRAAPEGTDGDREERVEGEVGVDHVGGGPGEGTPYTDEPVRERSVDVRGAADVTGGARDRSDDDRLDREPTGIQRVQQPLQVPLRSAGLGRGPGETQVQ